MPLEALWNTLSTLLKALRFWRKLLRLWKWMRSTYLTGDQLEFEISGWMQAIIWNTCSLPRHSHSRSCQYPGWAEVFSVNTKALFLLELFADLHPIFANEYVHHVDSDSILVCEVTAVAEAVCERFNDLDTLPTPKSVAFLKFGCWWQQQCHHYNTTEWWKTQPSS